MLEIVCIEFDDKKRDDCILKNYIRKPEAAVDLLSEWKYRQQKNIGPCSFIFTTLDGNIIKARYMKSMISRYANKAFICKDVSPYTLRHTYGAKLYKTNEDMKKVKRNLGLTDSNHLKIYSIFADQDVGFLY
jgi:integrase/recombinase XerD